MARLTITNAARVAGISRHALSRAITRGRVRRDADGLVDTAELERAGYTLLPNAGALTETRQRARSTEQERNAADTPQTDSLPQDDTDFFLQLRDELRRELNAAHARQLRLLRLVEQLSRYVAKTLHPGGASALGASPPPQIRTPIMTLLRKHYPEGLTRKEIETSLNSPKNLRNTLQGMYREGLVARLDTGVYTVAPEHRSTDA